MKKEKNLTFSQALVFLKEGKKIARNGWTNMRDSFLYLKEKPKSSNKNICIGYRDSICLLEPSGLAVQWNMYEDILENDWFLK